MKKILCVLFLLLPILAEARGGGGGGARGGSFGGSFGGARSSGSFGGSFGGSRSSGVVGGGAKSSSSGGLFGGSKVSPPRVDSGAGSMATLKGGSSAWRTSSSYVGAGGKAVKIDPTSPTVARAMTSTKPESVSTYSQRSARIFGSNPEAYRPTYVPPYYNPSYVGYSQRMAFPMTGYGSGSSMWEYYLLYKIMSGDESERNEAREAAKADAETNARIDALEKQFLAEGKKPDPTLIPKDMLENEDLKYDKGLLEAKEENNTGTYLMIGAILLVGLVALGFFLWDN